MEDSQLKHRIRIFQYIQEAWRDSGKRRSLVDILADHTFGMTREELEKFLFETLAPSLEEAWRKGDAAERRLAEKDHDLEEERKARKAAEKEAADREKENAALRKALTDARDTKATDNRDRFGSSCRKTRHSVDRDLNNDRTDRREEKENHDGTADVLPSSSTTSPEWCREIPTTTP